MLLIFLKLLLPYVFGFFLSAPALRDPCGPRFDIVAVADQVFNMANSIVVWCGDSPATANRSQPHQGATMWRGEVAASWKKKNRRAKQHICALPWHSPDEFITAGNEVSTRSQHNHNSCRCLLNWFSFCQLGISIVAKAKATTLAKAAGVKEKKCQHKY